MMYKGEFTIEDFDAVKAELSRQGICDQPIVWLVGSEEQVRMSWEKFHAAMVAAIEKFINHKKGY